MEDKKKYVPYRWFVLTVTSIAVMVLYMNLTAYAPILTQIAKKLNVEVSVATNLMSAFHLSTALGLLLAGVVCDRWGVKVSLLLGALLGTIPATSMTWLGDNYSLVLVLRVIQGISVSFALITMGPVMALWFPRREYGLAGSLMIGSVAIGSGTGPFFSSMVFDRTADWHQTVGILSIFGWVVIALVLVLRGSVAPQKPTGGGVDTGGEGVVSFKMALAQPVTWLGVVIIFCFTWAGHSIYALVPTYLAALPPLGIGLGPVMSGKLSLTLAAAGLFATFVGGIFLDKVAKGNFRLALSMGCAITGIFSCLIIFPTINTSMALLPVCLILAGGGAAFGAPSVNAFYVSIYPPSILARVIGLVGGIGKFGGATGIYVGGVLAAKTGTLSAAIISISLISFIIVVLAFFLKRPNWEEKILI